MSETHALAAGQGGTVTILPPPSQDEVHRQSAAAELAGDLAQSGALLARCVAMANATRGDRLGPMYAAARLMNANAQVARALAHVGLVERRTRTIVETIQPPKPENAELNSRFHSAEEDDAARAELSRRIDAIVETERQEQERLDGLAIGCCI
jgi:hypothetical protein